MTCKSTSVEVSNDLSKPTGIIVIKAGQHEFKPRFNHAGTITHVCREKEGHAGLCECQCGEKWLRHGSYK